MSLMHTARPDKNLYFTEQMIIERPSGKTIDIAQTVKRMLVDTTRNWSKNVILWNLAADPRNEPHTNNGGCPMCQGGITIDRDAVSYNLAYYTIAHASKFVRPGSVRMAAISSTTTESSRSRFGKAYSTGCPNVSSHAPRPVAPFQCRKNRDICARVLDLAREVWPSIAGFPRRSCAGS